MYAIGTRTPGRTLAGALAACILAISPASAQEAAAAASPATIADLSWIAGAWTAQNGSRTIEEHWVAASNALLGMGRTVAGGRMVGFEYLRIEARPEGLFYVAQPSGRPPTSFRLTAWDGTTATFENPEHDFPKRVIYTRTGENAVTAMVDGGEGTNALTFTYTRSH